MSSSLQQISPDYCEMRGVSILTASSLTGKDKADFHFLEKITSSFHWVDGFVISDCIQTGVLGRHHSVLRAAKSTLF